MDVFEKILRSAKYQYISEILLDWKFGDCDTVELVHAFETVIDVGADEFMALMKLANGSAEDKYLS